jgi:hypothetical protein
MALAHCILGKFLGVGCHCFPPPLDVSTFSARCLHVQRRERALAGEGGTLRGREMFRQIPSTIRYPRNCRDLLHAANLRHGTDGCFLYICFNIILSYKPRSSKWFSSQGPPTKILYASLLYTIRATFPAHIIF